MSYVGAVLIVVWVVGILCLGGLYLNDLRRVYNCFVPGALQTSPMDRLGSYGLLRFRFSRIDPELLTETGRVYRASAILHERLSLTWGICGFIVIVSYFVAVPPSRPQPAGPAPGLLPKYS
jgi:hypothetical protein